MNLGSEGFFKPKQRELIIWHVEVVELVRTGLCLLDAKIMDRVKVEDVID
jgi:hypothetical protein